MDMEWRKPFALVMNKNQIPEHQQYQLRYTIRESVVTPPISVSDYTFKRIDSDLLIAIDNDDVVLVEKALKKDKIDVNNLYVIPAWEVPEAGKPVFQTFLHRALWERSENVFKFLLDKGANPRIKGHCHDTVISNVFDDQYKKEDFLIKLPSCTFIGEIKGVTSNVKYEHISQIELHYRGYLDLLAERKENNSSLLSRAW